VQELPKQYDHLAAQERWYPFWEEHGYFHSDPDPERKRFPKGPYTIVIPPPNVTGALHLGHALNNTLQDILIRSRRMQGFNALWMPGTDHAGIATQAVVERRLLQEEKKSRHDLGREALVARIWAWKDEYEARILEQLKQMGCTCDWRRTRFTLDEQCARAVRHTFFRMFKDGLIYRGKRLVNWDTFLQTAVSDDEVFHETVKGHFWHFRYPVIDRQPGEPTHVTIATTRPETMLGDTAVAVHPDPAMALAKAERELREKLASAPAKEKAEIEKQLDDMAERRRTLLPQLAMLRDLAHAGRKLMLPLLNRPIPLIADEWAKPALGSGCVKITPAHDPNDYDVWQRHKEIGAINILNPDGTLNENAGPYKGLKVLKARERVAADLEAQGLLEKVEDREVELAHSDRSKTPIEPYLSDQWFLRMGDSPDGRPGLAQSAMDAVTSCRVKIHPERYSKTYLDWLGEKRDWCIGRQLWWGHQIPVWHVHLKGNIYQQEEGGARASVQRVVTEFRTAFDEYALACSLSGQFAIAQSEEAKSFLFICAQTEEAATEIRNFCRRHRLQNAERSGADYLVEPPLPDSDPRRNADLKLRSLLDRTSDPKKDRRILDQDPDVLDTWFSSQLWPHSTLGWPEQTPELAYYYPTSALLTSRGIITLWVVRMVLAGLYNLDEVPFHDVYIHPTILDGYGETMSKSKGNGVDPLDVIKKFGADALRFGLAFLATETQDVRLPVEFECAHCHKAVEQTQKSRVQPRVKCPHCGNEFSTQWAAKPEDAALPRAAVISDRFELARNFCNKLWNAARFTLLNLEGYTPGAVDLAALTTEDRWILSRLATVTEQITDALDQFHFAEAARQLYDFAWGEFCSFYLEMVKTRLSEPSSRATAQRVLAHVLDSIVRLLHPMVPFITEEIWQRLAEAAPERGLTKPTRAIESVMIAPWPEVDRRLQDSDIEARFAKFQAVLSGLREVRSRQSIPPKTPIHFAVKTDPTTQKLLEPMAPYFAAMAGATATTWGPAVQPPAQSANFTAVGCDVFVDLAGHIDLDAERARKEKESEQLLQQIEAKERKLANENFVSRAPADVVQKERESLTALRDRLASTSAALDELKRP
jgi:valyl-tRNA synthetase